MVGGGKNLPWFAGTGSQELVRRNWFGGTGSQETCLRQWMPSTGILVEGQRGGRAPARFTRDIFRNSRK